MEKQITITILKTHFIVCFFLILEYFFFKIPLITSLFYLIGFISYVIVCLFYFLSCFFYLVIIFTDKYDYDIINNVYKNNIIYHIICSINEKKPKIRILKLFLDILIIIFSWLNNYFSFGVLIIVIFVIDRIMKHCIFTNLFNGKIAKLLLFASIDSKNKHI